MTTRKNRRQPSCVDTAVQLSMIVVGCRKWVSGKVTKVTAVGGELCRKKLSGHRTLWARQEPHIKRNGARDMIGSN